MTICSSILGYGVSELDENEFLGFLLIHGYFILGGPCSTTDCSKDSIVIASENLVKNNIVVSVAAGNEGCNACYGSPNGAPNALAGNDSYQS
jgi:hypothetical protein